MLILSVEFNGRNRDQIVNFSDRIRIFKILILKREFSNILVTSM